MVKQVNLNVWKLFQKDILLEFNIPKVCIGQKGSKKTSKINTSLTNILSQYLSAEVSRGRSEVKIL